MTLEDKLITMVGRDWYEVMSEYLRSQSFLRIGATIANARTTQKIYPDPVNVFRAFRETGYHEVKVVLLGQDPYHDGSASGLSFDCSNALRDNPSLRIMLQEIDIEYPQDQFDIAFGKLDRGNLERWAKQGVLLLNRALTVVEKTPKSHLELWKPFTDHVIATLNAKHNVVFLLLGKDAQTVTPLIDNTNFIVQAAHPAVHVYGGTGFLNSGVFRQVNEHLASMNKKEINW
jgi:uracil-DNA glycosylase